MKGFRVLNPMGFDSFGLPAERSAVKENRHPRADHAGADLVLPEAAAAPRLLVQLGARGLDVRAGLLPLDAVDLPEALREGARLPRRGPRQLVPCAGDGAVERRGAGRKVRRDGRSGRAPHHAPMDAAHHRVRRSAARRSRRARLAPRHPRDAAQLDRAQRRRGGALPDRRQRCVVRGVHDATRHALRRDVLRARARAPAARGDRDAASQGGGRRVRRGRTQPVGSRSPVRGREGQDRHLHRCLRDQSRHERAHPDLDGRLRADVVRHRAPSWPCRDTTSAITRSPRSSVFRSWK